VQAAAAAPFPAGELVAHRGGQLAVDFDGDRPDRADPVHRLVDARAGRGSTSDVDSVPSEALVVDLDDGRGLARWAGQDARIGPVTMRCLRWVYTSLAVTPSGTSVMTTSPCSATTVHLRHPRRPTRTGRCACPALQMLTRATSVTRQRPDPRPARRRRRRAHRLLPLAAPLELQVLATATSGGKHPTLHAVAATASGGSDAFPQGSSYGAAGTARAPWCRSCSSSSCLRAGGRLVA